MNADARFAAALRAVMNGLGAIDAPSMIIGGVAVIASGVPRATIDIDATVLGRVTTADAIFDAMREHLIVARIDRAREFARERHVLLLRHEPTGTPVEVSLGWLPFEEHALSRAIEVDMEGVSVRVARPEDLIVYKAAAWRDRDRSDIERLIALHRDEIDLSRVRDLVAQIAAALDDHERVRAFDELVARATNYK